MIQSKDHVNRGKNHVILGKNFVILGKNRGIEVRIRFSVRIV